MTHKNLRTIEHSSGQKKLKVNEKEEIRQYLKTKIENEMRNFSLLGKDGDHGLRHTE